MTPGLETVTWLSTFQELLRYYLPEVPNSPTVYVASLTAVLGGAFLVFRAWKFERFVISLCGFVAGAWLGHMAAQFVGTPAPIPAAVGGILVTLGAYRTYRLWLACGSVAVLFGAALVFQLGQGDLQRYLPSLNEGPPIRGDRIGGLPSPEQMTRNLNADWRDQLARMKGPIVHELKGLGPAGWGIPVVAAIVGGLLAFWTLRAFSMIWLGLFGSLLVAVGLAAFICAHWPSARTWLITESHYPAFFAIGLWLLGLVLQAREARFPKKSGGDSDATSATDSAK